MITVRLGDHEADWILVASQLMLNSDEPWPSTSKADRRAFLKGCQKIARALQARGYDGFSLREVLAAEPR